MKHLALLFALGIGLSSMPAATRAAGLGTEIPAYAITDLGFFQARELDERPGFNSAAQVAAWQVLNQTRVVAVLIAAGAPAVLPGLPNSANSYALGLNDRGDVVGVIESTADVRDTQAFVYRNGMLETLPSIDGRSAAARSISSAGVIAGSAMTADHQMHAALWLQGKFKDLGTLPGGDFSRALAVNERGEIVGEANRSINGKARAVIWSRGRVRELGLLPGGTFSSAQAINGGGQSVGYSDDAAGQAKAVRFRHGRAENLGTLGDEPSSALGINDGGSIVGASAISEGAMRAFLWRDGRIYDLNRLVPASGWMLLSAYRINAAGDILAYGFYRGRTHICLLTPHPRDRARQ